MHEAFNKAERDVENSYGHPVARRAREGRAPDIEAVYAVGDHPRFYYVEATRRYRLLGQTIDDCEAVGFGTGWFAREGSQVRSLEIGRRPACRATAAAPATCCRSARCAWPESCSGSRSFPAGIDERYVVVEIKPKTVAAVINVWGGSCQR